VLPDLEGVHQEATVVAVARAQSVGVEGVVGLTSEVVVDFDQKLGRPCWFEQRAQA
jgi:hypothetical protein